MARLTLRNQDSRDPAGAMKVIKVTKDYYETEDEKVYFFEPLEKEILVDDLQKIVDANEKLVKELQHERDSSNKRR